MASSSGGAASVSAASSSAALFSLEPESSRPARPHNILEYLATLDSADLTQLYADNFTVITIFRSLPVLAKHTILRVLYCEEHSAIAKSLIDSWVQRDDQSLKAKTAAFEKLIALRILLPHTTASTTINTNTTTTTNITTTTRRSTDAQFELNSAFQRTMRTALLNSVADRLETVVSSSSEDRAAQLDVYATNKWDQLLHFMIGCETYGAPPKPLLQRLEAMSLMQRPSPSASLRITSLGFAFLFKPQHAQLWDCVIAYMASLPSDMNRYEVLTFLFRLTFLKLGQAYATRALTTTQQTLLQHLAYFGLIYQDSPTASTFFATHLALALSSSSEQALSPVANAEGYIIIETTFKVYAFTTSPLQIALLRLFVRLDYQLPNMVVGVITKQSLLQALKNNITADDLLSFLSTYAHPQMRNQTPLLPANVKDQIQLWAKERARLTAQRVDLICEFESPEEFNKVRRVVPAASVLWMDAKRLLMVVTPDTHLLIKQWKQQQQQQLQQHQR